MRVVIFGSNGMLGRYLTSYLKNKYEVLPLTRADLDVSKTNELDIFEFLNKNINQEDIIINTIVSKNGNIDEMIKVNSIFPKILSKFKTDISCHIIHITTDGVFSGEKGDYKETDPHDYTNDYGKSKSNSEDNILTIIRTSIIGEETDNKKSLLEWTISNKNQTIEGYDNHLWNGITCLELAKLIERIIRDNLFWNGVRHIYSPDTISKYDLLSMINQIYNLNLNINKKINKQALL